MQNRTVSHSGVNGEVETEDEHSDWVRTNTHMLYEHGLFTSFVELLAMEIE